jgi:hypothetical protein
VKDDVASYRIAPKASLLCDGLAGGVAIAKCVSGGWCGGVGGLAVWGCGPVAGRLSVVKNW